MSDSKKQVFVKGMAIDGLPNVRYDAYFRIFGLVSSGMDVQSKLAGKEKSGNRGRRLYCQFVCALLWFFAIRSFVLMFIGDRNIQVMMGDLTGYWNEYRMYYLMPMLLFSIQTAITATIFLIKERDLAWLVPFISIKQLQISSTSRAMQQFRPSHHKIRIYVGILFDLVSWPLSSLLDTRYEIGFHSSSSYCYFTC